MQENLTDKELLELAAKAAGVKGPYFEEHDCGINYGERLVKLWNPLTWDGDALRLAVKLGIDITVSGKQAAATSHTNGPCFQEYANGDLYAATRRAIVRAAAEIGQSR